MKMLLFSNLYPTSAEPTRGVFTQQLATELGKLCELTIAVPLPWFPQSAVVECIFPDYARRFSRLEANTSSDGIPVSFPRYPLIPRLSEAAHARLMQVGVGPHIERLHRQRNFDVINAHWLYPDGVVATRLGKALGVPVVLTALGCDVNEFLLHRDKRGKILEALDGAAAVTAVSSHLAEILREAGVPPAKLSVIPNGVSLTRFQPVDSLVARSRLGIPGDAPVIVCVSRLTEEKGVRFLIEAAARVRSQIPNVLIRIVGDGSEVRRLKDRVTALGLMNTVEFVGAVPHPEVAHWLAAASVVCIPSLREGHPNVAMEALACGSPIVASSVGGLPDFIDAHCGILVPPGEPDKLATALVAALTRSWQKEQIAASVRECSWERAARRYVEVAKSVSMHAAARLELAM